LVNSAGGDMKILCVCQRGNVRSVACAYILKDELGWQAVAIGTDTAGKELWDILGKWADRIYVCGELELMQKVPEKFWTKTIHLNIGRDRWGNPINSDLLNTLKEKMIEKKDMGQF
jgi:hypothetical protein